MNLDALAALFQVPAPQTPAGPAHPQDGAAAFDPFLAELLARANAQASYDEGLDGEQQEQGHEAAGSVSDDPKGVALETSAEVSLEIVRLSLSLSLSLHGRGVESPMAAADAAESSTGSPALPHFAAATTDLAPSAFLAAAADRGAGALANAGSTFPADAPISAQPLPLGDASRVPASADVTSPGIPAAAMQDGLAARESETPAALQRPDTTTETAAASIGRSVTPPPDALADAVSDTERRNGNLPAAEAALRTRGLSSAASDTLAARQNPTDTARSAASTANANTATSPIQRADSAASPTPPPFPATSPPVTTDGAQTPGGRDTLVPSPNNPNGADAQSMDLRDARATLSAPTPRSAEAEFLQASLAERDAAALPPTAMPVAATPATGGLDAASARPVAPPALEGALQAKIEWLSQQGGGAARLHLQPAELGGVEISVRVRGQQVDVMIRAEQDAAQRLVLDARERLVDALASRDLRVESLEVRSNETGGAIRDASPTAPQGDTQQHAARERHGEGNDPRPAPQRTQTGSPTTAALASTPTPSAHPSQTGALSLRV